MSGAQLVQTDSWLSEVMQRPVFRLNQRAMADTSAPLELREVLSTAGAFCFAKVNARQVALVKRLHHLGFAVVDVNVTFELKRPPAPLQSMDKAAQIREFVASDEEGVLDIAGSCFEFSRFHLDPHIERYVADSVKREWVRNYARRSRGDRLFVATVGGHPAGFLAALLTDAHAVIDLVGVDKIHQGQHLGAALVGAFIEHYRPSGRSLLVGTQAANAPSIRLYEKMGFSFLSAEYVLHLHVRS